MVEETIVSAMWHRTRKCYVPLTLNELLEKTGLDRPDINRTQARGIIEQDRDVKGMRKVVCIYNITEAGKRLHQGMKEEI